MTLQEFLADRMRGILFWASFMAAAALFLSATGTQTGVIVILMIVTALAASTMQAMDFLRRRTRLRELEAILNGLDKKYLFSECVPPARDLYEDKLLEMLRRSGRSMIGAVSDAQAAQREYQEYVESWVHEIKTPITAARLICRNAGGEIRKKLSHELGQMEAHVERALFYARAGSPEKDVVIRPFSLEELVSQSIQNHKELLMQGGVRIETEGLDSVVYTDKKWICFILGQLLQNSVRYRGESPVITMSARQAGKQVSLTVAENGIGIPAHELPRIFDRGFTGSNGRTRGGSTGMGLYLCRKLTEFLEIQIQADSEEGQGTDVTLVFPAMDAFA